MKAKNKIMSMLLISSMAIGLIGCGSAAPVMDEDVLGSSTETTVESRENTEKTDSEKTTEAEIGNGEAAESEKTEETVTPEPTQSPIPTAEPTPTAEPSPTPTPHVHEYEETVTKQPSCAEDGVKTLTCACGDSKTEAIPATGNHNWVEEIETVVIPSTGHVVTTEVQVQVGVGETRHEYECVYCGHREDSADAIEEHYRSTIPEGNIDHSFSRTLIWDYPGEPIYETQTVSEWVIDTPETTSVVGTGRFTCSVCGATK